MWQFSGSTISWPHMAIPPRMAKLPPAFPPPAHAHATDDVAPFFSPSMKQPRKPRKRPASSAARRQSSRAVHQGPKVRSTPHLVLAPHPMDCAATLGHLFVTGSFDRTVRVWEPQTGRTTLTLRGHTGEVMISCSE